MSFRMKFFPFVFIGLALVSTDWQAQVEFFGNDIAVNTVTDSNQQLPDVAALANGGFVVAWSSEKPGGIQDIAARLFAGDGSPLGDEFKVNFTTAVHSHPVVGSGGDTVIVVWRSADADGTGVFGHRLATDGSLLGSEFQVNETVTGSQQYAEVAADADGNFVIAWESEASPETDTSLTSILARRFASDGTPLDSEFQVNSVTSQEQRDPAVASEKNGDFTVTWASYDVEHPVFANDIYRQVGQRFASNGDFVGGEFEIGAANQFGSSQTEVALDHVGRFEVVWSERYSVFYANRFDEIEAASFDQEGSAGDSGTIEHTNGPVRVDEAKVSKSGAGEFIIVWRHRNVDTSEAGIRAIYKYHGASSTSETFWIEELDSSAPRNPEIARLRDGKLLLVWAAAGGDGLDIYGQLFAQFFFADGFESGDVDAWSSASGVVRAGSD